MDFICFNGEMLPANQPVIKADNRSFKYGDGVFETIKVCGGKIPFGNLHFERLISSLQLLKIMPSFDEAYLRKAIISLCQRNNCTGLARVRLAVYRDERNSTGFVIEATSLTAEANQWDEKGLMIDLYPYARKAKDAFANLKTANFLPYVLAGLYANENHLDDCIVLNADNNICDTSKANIFLVKYDEIFTPALHQGCVNGVMRRFLIDGLKNMGFAVHQQEITEDDLAKADEVFLTNAIYGLRWVQLFREKKYTDTSCRNIYQQLLANIY